MPIIRKKLAPSDVYPEDIRYNEETDTVQRKIGGEWVDAPESDPRKQTTFPPRLTTDPACDAAQSIADAMKNQVTQIITAIENTATVFAIAGLILGLFTFGVFDIFISLALAAGNAMIAAGSEALNDALTEPVWHQFMCIVKCHLDGNGRVKPGEFDLIGNDIVSQIGGLAGATLLSFVTLAGEGGMNNLAAIGLSTGDCLDCGCSECDMDLWNIYSIGDEISREGNFIIGQSANVAGVYGNHRWSLNTGDKDTGCCCFVSIEILSGGAAPTTFKHAPCGHDVTSEETFPHGIPSPGTSVWAMAIDSQAPFTVKLTLAGC